MKEKESPKAAKTSRSAWVVLSRREKIFKKNPWDQGNDIYVV